MKSGDFVKVVYLYPSDEEKTELKLGSIGVIVAAYDVVELALVDFGGDILKPGHNSGCWLPELNAFVIKYHQLEVINEA